MWEVLGKKATEVKLCFHYVMPVVHGSNMTHIVDVNIDCLAEIVFVRFPHYKFIFYPSCHSIFGRMSLGGFILKQNRIMSHILESGLPTKIIWNFLHMRFFPPFIYLLNNSYQYRIMDIYFTCGII